VFSVVNRVLRIYDLGIIGMGADIVEWNCSQFWMYLGKRCRHPLKGPPQDYLREDFYPPLEIAGFDCSRSAQVILRRALPNGVLCIGVHRRIIGEEDLRVVVAQAS
jgi:hypothetical protein